MYKNSFKVLTLNLQVLLILPLKEKKDLFLYQQETKVILKFSEIKWIQAPFVKDHKRLFSLFKYIHELLHVFLHKVDGNLKVEEVEIYYDPAELMGGLLPGTHTNSPTDDASKSSAIPQACPFSK